MYYLPYNENLKEFSRKLRNHSTLGEILLWKQLRAGSMDYTFEHGQKLKDAEHQKKLESMGLNFLRFDDEEIKKNMLQALQKTRDYIVSFDIQTHERKLSP